MRWWQLDRAARAEPVAKLADWVADVYLPGFGHLAAALPPCWPRHDLCLYVLDVLSQYWALLWVPAGRTAGTLGGQADWLTRILPPLASMMQAEGRSCRHTDRAAVAR